MKLIFGERILAGEKRKLAFVNLDHQRVPAPADRAVAHRELWKVGLDFEAHSSAVARSKVGLQKAGGHVEYQI
jgi:hypothetical protein